MLTTTANALLGAQVAFIVGGTFQAELLNDLNWFMFGLVAALDRVTASVAASDADACEMEKVPQAAAATPSFGSHVAARSGARQALTSWR